ncbi:MAG: SIS domain-containing protein [Candidatus Jordarchaeales archaeon]
MPGRRAFLALRDILEEDVAVKLTIDAVSNFLGEIAPRLAPPGFVYLTGSGTSYHASIVGQYALSRLSSTLSSSIPASEFTHWTSMKGAGTMVVAVSRSGETLDTLNAAKYAKSRGATVLALTNNGESSLARLSHFFILTRAGDEKSGVATKSYVSQLAALYLLAAFLGEVKGCKEAAAFKPLLYDLPESVRKTVALSQEQAKSVAEECREAELFLILGSGANYATALEAALKLEEVANLPAEGLSASAFLHEPVQPVDEKTAVVMLLPPRKQAEVYIEAASRFEKLGSKVIVVADWESGFDNQLLVPANDPLLSPVLFIIPLQFFSCYISKLKKADLGG